MLSGLRIGAGFYLFSKLSHGMLAALIAWLIGPMVLGSEAITTGSFGREEIVSSLGFFSQLLFSTKMVIMIVILFLITIFADSIFKKHQQRKTEERS
jgi:uncharacterized membrane protein